MVTGGRGNEEGKERKDVERYERRVKGYASWRRVEDKDRWAMVQGKRNEGENGEVMTSEQLDNCS